MLTERRHDRLLEEHNHDPYRTTRKIAEPARCPECGAVYRAGRWRWLRRAPADARPELCQACRRVRDDCAAGIVSLRGDFVREHEEELLAAMLRQERLERERHPLHRIMDVKRDGDAVVVRTTDIHLPQRIGKALRRAYDGTLALHFDRDAYFLRLEWTR